MTELSKLEVLELIAKSDDVSANEKFCILSNTLPKEAKDYIIARASGMMDMAELYVNRGLEHGVSKIWDYQRRK